MFVNELHQGGIRAILDWDPTVFDDMVLPDGVQQQEVVDDIIIKYGDTPLFCPDPAVIKYYIKVWSAHKIDLWNRYKAAISAQYNPIENYDRYESGTDTNEVQVSADNESDYQPDTKAIRTPDLHIHGNIGVTSSMQLINQELDLIPRLDLVDYIADDFHTEFCLYVY